MALSRYLSFRFPSPIRSTLLVMVAFGWGFVLSHFPSNRATPWLIFPFLLGLIGTADTIRCMRRKWSWYHGGILLLIYTDLMVLTLLLFFLLYPYAHWLASSH